MESLVVAPIETPAQGPDDEALAKAGEAAVQAGNTHSEDKAPEAAKERPEWVPEKFWNPDTGEVDTEGLAKSYRELEKSRSQPKTPEGAPKLETVADAQALAMSKNIDFNALTQEYDTKGDLSDETYESLEKQGIPKDIVKQFVDGQRAAANEIRQEALKAVGGEDKFKEMSEWARHNMPKDDLDAYNKAVATNDMNIVKLAMSALKAKYVEANGQPPKSQVGGRRADSSTVEPFESRTQFVDAIKDPRYERDQAYRNQVTKRLEASNIF